MPTVGTVFLTAATMVFFAANSVLARLALRADEIDAGTFTAVRVASGVLALALLVRSASGASVRASGSWVAAGALFAYAAAFSFAYLSLDAGVGALILFATVQITMISAGLRRGEQPVAAEWAGLVLALGGLVYLVSPGLTAPAPGGAALMAVSGVAWGSYSLAARGVTQPTAATAGNFVRATPAAVGLVVLVWVAGRGHATPTGLLLAAISGAVTSGLGYAMWYRALHDMTATRAAIVQLTVPVIAAAAGVMFLSEPLTARLVLAAAVIIGGVSLAFAGRSRQRPR